MILIYLAIRHFDFPALKRLCYQGTGMLEKPGIPINKVSQVVFRVLPPKRVEGQRFMFTKGPTEEGSK